MRLSSTKQKLKSWDVPAQVPANVLNLDLSHAVSTYQSGKTSISEMPESLPVFRGGRIVRFTSSQRPRVVSMPAAFKSLPDVPPESPFRVDFPTMEHRPRCVSLMPLTTQDRLLQPLPPAPVDELQSLSSHASDLQFSIPSETTASSLSGTSLRILQFVDTYVSESSDSIISKYERFVDPEVRTLSDVSLEDSLFSDLDSVDDVARRVSQKSLPDLPLAPLANIKVRKRAKKTSRSADRNSMISTSSQASSNSLQESKLEIKSAVLKKPFSYCLDSPKDYGNSRFPLATLMPNYTKATPALSRPPIQPRAVTALPDLQHTQFNSNNTGVSNGHSMLLMSSNRYQDPWKRVLSSKQLPATPDERQNRFAYTSYQ